MPKRMLIDASHPEETRVVVIDGNRVEEFDFEAAAKRPLKGNIYLAKVTRVEPSLQAAFVEYGGNRQGFLAFSEIHPDYYQIPVADRMAILQAQTERLMAEEDAESLDTPHTDDSSAQGEDAENHENSGDALPDHVHEGASSYAESQPANDDAAAASHGFEPESGIEETESETRREQASEPPLIENRFSVEIADFGAELAEGPQASVDEAAVEHALDSMVQPEAVQTEATGAPVAYQKREGRHGPHDRPRPRRRQYKIQEVIKRRQVMLVQVVKEERGNKGASLTTFLSLAGRYCVLMPNTPRGGGISRKITNAVDRKRLKAAAQSLDLPEGMGLIIRTAGANRTKAEIKRDYEYLLRLWDTVRELTLKSNAPALVYEEGSLIKRAIRDLYSKEISEIIVDGETGYREAKEFMRMLMPSHAKNVKLYREPLPLFQKLQVESQLDAMFSPVVNLRSGGYVVINQTEALVAIDVNSGKATREHSIEETALKTNLEASDEIARQLRLRDLAGLIVIDFIDMEDSKNDRTVEKRLHNAVRNDRARIQIGRISQFGLLELSRQRLRAGVVASSTITCPHCNGQGIIRSTESAALRLLRALDEEGQRQPSVNLTVKTPSEVSIYTLNQKRREIARIEEAYDVSILFDPQQNMVSGSFEIQRTGMRIPAPRPKLAAVSVEGGFHEAEAAEPEKDVTIVEPPEPSVAAEPVLQQETAGGDMRGRKRRRRRRGGRGRTERFGAAVGESEIHAAEASEGVNEFAPVEGDADADESEDSSPAGETSPMEPAATDAGERRRRRRRRGRRGRRFEHERPGSADPSIPEQPVYADASPMAADIAVTRPAVEERFALRAGFAGSQAEEIAVIPNTPSSPVWSLLDQQTVPEPSAATPEPLAAAPELPEIAPVPAASATPAERDTSPRETRKGWWQRRFKA
jgi:ribonuclease E